MSDEQKKAEAIDVQSVKSESKQKATKPVSQPLSESEKKDKLFELENAVKKLSISTQGKENESVKVRMDGNVISFTVGLPVENKGLQNTIALYNRLLRGVEDRNTTYEEKRRYTVDDMAEWLELHKKLDQSGEFKINDNVFSFNAESKSITFTIRISKSMEHIDELIDAVKGLDTLNTVRWRNFIDKSHIKSHDVEPIKKHIADYDALSAYVKYIVDDKFPGNNPVFEEIGISKGKYGKNKNGKRFELLCHVPDGYNREEAAHKILGVLSKTFDRINTLYPTTNLRGDKPNTIRIAVIGEVGELLGDIVRNDEERFPSLKWVIDSKQGISRQAGLV